MDEINSMNKNSNTEEENNLTEELRNHTMEQIPLIGAREPPKLSKKGNPKYSREEQEAIWKKHHRIAVMFDYSDLDKSIGNLRKDFDVYYAFHHTNFVRLSCDEIKKIRNMFPKEFRTTRDPVIFNGTHWIGFDLKDKLRMYPEDYPEYIFEKFPENNSDENMVYEYRSKSQLVVFEHNNPDKVHTVLVKIWKSPKSWDYWFKHVIRPNRIYLTDYDGLKVYDFELNLLFFRPVLKFGDVYGFSVDSDNWNNVRFWSVEQAKQLKQNEINQYDNINGLESISELVMT